LGERERESESERESEREREREISFPSDIILFLGVGRLVGR
jgi:hypothetical protein